MAPNGDALVAPPLRQKPRRISMEGLQRAMSDLAFEFTRDRKAAVEETAAAARLPAISEQVEDAKCECCGMSEECTPGYVRRVRERFSGRWICGLCAEAVKAEAEKGGGDEEAALRAHMSVCGRFNRVGRAMPVLVQAEAMREILRKRCKSNSPREKKGAIARSSSCIPAITKDLN